METKEFSKEIFVIVLASIILAIVVSFTNNKLIYSTAICFLIIILANTFVKKLIGSLLEIGVKIKFWSWHQYGFRKDSHFKSPVPMVWFPLIISLFTRGALWWLAILEFDVYPKTERVSRRHGLYRFTEVTEWHIAWIAIWGIITNLVLAVVGYLAGFELFARLSIYYTVWSIIPLSSLDGSKIFFSSRYLWATIAVIVAIFLGWGLLIV
jgi:hypothetical protein